MEAIKIVRMKDGFDIITSIDLVRGEYLVKNPMVVDLHYRKGSAKPELVMTNWLPVPILIENEASISTDTVVCLMEPNATLKEYYENLVSRSAEYLTSESMEDTDEVQELAEAMLELETSKGISIH
jgi:hypothetical protein